VKHSKNAVECPGCKVRFCSSECLERSTKLWHGAACGNAAVARAEEFCEGKVEIEDLKLDAPWRAGMGGFKMLLSLVMAARQGVGPLRNLHTKYMQIRAHHGDIQLFNRAKAELAPRVSALWTCWEDFAKTEPTKSLEVLQQEVQLDFDFLCEMVMKYNQQNQQGGLYNEISFCAHNCRPNVALQPLDIGGPLRLFAVRHLSPGDELTMTFIAPNLSKDERRSQLKEKYGIDCKCRRCLSDSDLPPEELALLIGGGGDAACCLM